MGRLFKFLSFIIVLGMISGLAILFGPGGAFQKGPLEKPVIIVIDKNDKINVMAQKLQDCNAISNWLGFYVAAALARSAGYIKAGEYEIPAGSSPYDIAQIFIHGKSIMHYLTIPEGRTIYEAVQLLNQAPHLKGELISIPPEGHILPETYAYNTNESRQMLLDRMHLALEKTLSKLWPHRAENCILKSPEEVLILASIIEKETGVSEERHRVAGVFMNRLKKGMRLQSDPTVIYGMTGGRTNMGRLLTTNDLKTPTPYNTYTISALPMGPIACPGKASIEAALHPENTNELYFVANGTGGHTFADSLAEHNKNVTVWRSINKKK